EAEAAGVLDEAGLARLPAGEHPQPPAGRVLVPDRHDERRPARFGRHGRRADVRLGQELLTVLTGQCHGPTRVRGSDTGRMNTALPPIRHRLGLVEDLYAPYGDADRERWWQEEPKNPNRTA